MTTFAEHYVPSGPRVKVGGVEYEISYGDGVQSVRMWDEVFVGPVYVWRCVDVPEYTAPKHVSDECNRVIDLQYEIESAERAAGWDPNP